MKKAMLVFGIILLMSVGLVGCEFGVSPPGSASSAEYAGTYVEQEHPSHFFKLMPNGMFYAPYSRSGIEAGYWDVEDNTLIVFNLGASQYSEGSVNIAGEFQGNKLIEPNGDVWVKK